MKLFLRILLFVLCINTGIFSYAADANSSLPPTLNSSDDGEVLEKNFVQLEVAADNTLSISILKSVQSLIKIVQTSQYYSLLNWNTYSRSQKDLVIENYDRKMQFGRWINDPNDDTCFNTRAKVLLRDSDKEVVFKDTNHCIVDSGTWNDPYTGKVFSATTDIQIDHVVPLKNAYMSGAYKWDFRSRCLYANYMGAEFHLLSVNGAENMKKGDKGPDRYMPPNKAHTCSYLKNWLTIKFMWGLKMTTSEAASIGQLIKDNHCNLANFRITTRELLFQQQFAKDNIDICQNVTPSTTN